MVVSNYGVLAVYQALRQYLLCKPPLRPSIVGLASHFTDEETETQKAATLLVSRKAGIQGQDCYQCEKKYQPHITALGDDTQFGASFFHTKKKKGVYTNLNGSPW